MTAHVAEAHEDRGRVVVYTPAAGRLDGVSIEAALRVARAFHSEIESLFVTDQHLLDLERFPFVSAISFDGTTALSLDPEQMKRTFETDARVAHRRITTAAALWGLASHQNTVTSDPVRAIATACAENGPWNIVALGEPIGAHSGPHIAALFETVEAATGFIAAGTKAQRATGPIIALVEDAERVAGIVRAAQRLADAEDVALHLWLVETESDGADDLEARVRLTLGLKAQALSIRSFDLKTWPLATLQAVLREMGAGFVMCRFGGLVMPPDLSDGWIGAEHEGSLLLVR